LLGDFRNSSGILINRDLQDRKFSKKDQD